MRRENDKMPLLSEASTQHFLTIHALKMKTFTFRKKTTTKKQNKKKPRTLNMKRSNMYHIIRPDYSYIAKLIDLKNFLSFIRLMASLPSPYLLIVTKVISKQNFLYDHSKSYSYYITLYPSILCYHFAYISATTQTRHMQNYSILFSRCIQYNLYKHAYSKITNWPFSAYFTFFISLLLLSFCCFFFFFHFLLSLYEKTKQ